MKERRMTIQEMRDSLRSSVCNVQFTKVDGSTRNLRCTLHPDYIPRGNANESSEPVKRRNPEYVSDNVLAVWDLDGLHWKSFRVSSVEKFEVLATLLKNMKGDSA